MRWRGWPPTVSGRRGDNAGSVFQLGTLRSEWGTESNRYPGEMHYDFIGALVGWRHARRHQAGLPGTLIRLF
jgi:hypothetical protein